MSTYLQSVTKAYNREEEWRRGNEGRAIGEVIVKLRPAECVSANWVKSREIGGVASRKRKENWEDSAVRRNLANSRN